MALNAVATGQPPEPPVKVPSACRGVEGNAEPADLYVVTRIVVPKELEVLMIQQMLYVASRPSEEIINAQHLSATLEQLRAAIDSSAA